MSDASSDPVITADQLLKHWQGHRALTRRIIDAFPEKDLLNYSIAGMRTMYAYAMECMGMAVPTLVGITTGSWPEDEGDKPQTKSDLLAKWDETTSEINRLWPKIQASRWQEVDTAFGQWKMPVHSLVLYLIDNEIHHRGQGYVYLRSLGIEPPAFYERD